MTIKNAVLDNILARRSTRSYSAKPLEKDILDTVIEAGRYAPSGMNVQLTHMIAISSPEAISQLCAAVRDALAVTEPREGMPPPFVAMLNRAKAGENIDVCYGAPVLIIVANKKDAKNAMADSACAMQNMMLTAASLEIGSCWINQFSILESIPAIRGYLETLGLADDERVYAALALGHTDNLETSPLPRSGNPVTYVD